MKPAKIKKISDEDILKAYRRGSREAEFEIFGRPLPINKLHKNKKAYTRKNKHIEDYE